MCDMTGFSVVYSQDKVSIEPHFCRAYDECGGGMDLSDACKIVADYYQSVADQWRAETHPDVLYYKEGL